VKKVLLKSFSVITKQHVVILRKTAILNNVANYPIFIISVFASSRFYSIWYAWDSSMRFYDHTHTHTKIGRTPLNVWLFRRRDLYPTTHSTHKRQISIHSEGFEPTIPASKRPSHKLKPAKYIFRGYILIVKN